MIMTRYRLPLILQCLIFLIPVNIYMIGDSLGAGVQWLLFRYQQTYMGTNFILASRDLTYVLTGLITGRSGISILIWIMGIVILFAALVFAVIAYVREEPAFVKGGSLLTILAGFVLLLASLVQYGITLSGPAGFAIPVGIPIILIIGWITYTADYGSSDGENVMESCDLETGNS